MSAIYEEFERELARLAARHAGRPRAELVRLFLLALEREELVSVGYRESLISARLAAMPLDTAVRELIHHALVWIWKDEEMHTIFIRGALLKLGGPRLRAQAFLHQAAGGVAGWSSSLLQHTRAGQAPLARGLAHLVTSLGSLLGKVPREVEPHIRYGPFRDFCLFNIDAEKTAWRCWARIVDLTEAESDFPPRLVSDFRRVVDDEARHERIFTFLAAALDDDDRLVPGETAESLAEQIRGVGEHFLPRRLRRLDEWQNPLGSGRKVWCLQGEEGDTKLPLFRRTLEEAGLAAALAERARGLDKPVGDLAVAVKPTFMLGYSRRDPSPVTDPELVAELARWLREQGVARVAVVEGRNIYDRFFHHRGVAEVAEYLGIRSPHFEVVDASDEQVPHSYSRGMAQHTISRTWKEADFRISFPRLRSHPIELALLTVGNVEWVGARCDEFIFLERQAERATAVMMLLDDCPPHFALLDGYDAAPDGLVGIMGCARPLAPRRFYAGPDALAVDLVAARHLGVNQPRDSSLLQSACHWFGGWPEEIEVAGCDQPVAGWRGPYHSQFSALLSLLAFPVYVLGSGRGSLFVPEMDEQAFPPLAPAGLFLRLGRGAVRRLLGLRLPRGDAGVRPRPPS